MSIRIPIPTATRSQVLIANRHACCVCGEGGVQLHHINGDPSDNRPQNLACLCLRHHDEATKPSGLTARLRASELRKYKERWEADCEKRSERVARGRTAFFMVDYKNPDRIRHLYSQLSSEDRLRAYTLLRQQFVAETKLREDQRFDVSLEPTTAWSPTVESLLEEVKNGTVHPRPFASAKGHPKDPLYPVGFRSFPLHDIWCQIMVRTLIAVRGTFDLDDLTRLDEPSEADLEGRLISFAARLVGDVAPPDEWQTRSTSITTLIRDVGTDVWTSDLHLRTHYVYSLTATSSLSKSKENGLLLFRAIDEVERVDGVRLVRFSCTPLIIGIRVLKIP